MDNPVALDIMAPSCPFLSRILTLFKKYHGYEAIVIFLLYMEFCSWNQFLVIYLFIDVIYISLAKYNRVELLADLHNATFTS